MATYAEIQAEIVKLQAQAEELKKSEQAKAVAEIRAKMAELGITLDDLRSAGARNSRKPVAAKYRDPKSGQTWAGRGRTPKWLQEAMAAGKTAEDFRIR